VMTSNVWTLVGAATAWFISIYTSNATLVAP